MFENESSNTSLSFDVVLFISPKIFVGYELDLLKFIHSLFHLKIKSFRSPSSSLLDLFFATVRIITPKPFGLIFLTKVFSLFFSS